MSLCYYVTSHGYGHAVRAAQVMKELPAGFPLIIRTLVPESFFREELGNRQFLYAPGEFDCGCIQSDSVTVLKRESLERYREISIRNRNTIKEELEFLRAHNVKCIASDVTPHALRLADEAGIPGYAIANFTWYDIYQEYIQTEDDKKLLDEIVADYHLTTRAFITPLDTITVRDVFPHVVETPLIARKGENIRDRIHAHLGNKATPYYALLYFGLWGLDLNWRILETFKEWTFFTYEAPPIDLQNVIHFKRDEWLPGDIAVSVNAVISKPGYGTISECIGNNVPFIYVPREGFAETPGLLAGMDKWGGGIQITWEQFKEGQWTEALLKALTIKMNRNAFQADGARFVAEKLV